MQKNTIGWIEIPVTDMERAEKFYTDYMGLTLERQDPKNGYTMSWMMPMDMEGYGAGCTLMHGPGYVPSNQGTMIYFTAPEGTVEASVKKATDMGVKVLYPKTDITPHGFMAVVEDSEGNSIAIHSMEG